MYVHLKQSGELLSSQGEPGEFWTPNGIRASTEKIASVHRMRDKLSVDGILMVSGAGNLVRGDHLRKHNIAGRKADLLGRLGTVMNTLVLAEALEERRVPTALFIADSMQLVDMNITYPPYDADAVKEAYESERVVLIAGGTGEDNKTTDNAVLEYAHRHRHSISDQDEVLVLKGTKFDGVFDGDPAKNAAARRFSKVSAGYMLRDYERYPVVDRACLDTINASNLSLRVYADGQHDLRTVLEAGDEIGTLIEPGNALPSFAENA